jgi:hypothetical protein
VYFAELPTAQSGLIPAPSFQSITPSYADTAIVIGRLSFQPDDQPDITDAVAYAHSGVLTKYLRTRRNEGLR